MSRFGSQETILHAITTDVVEAVLDGLLVAHDAGRHVRLRPALRRVVLVGACCMPCCAGRPTRPCARPRRRPSCGRRGADSHFLETLRGIKTIKLFNGQDARRAHWLNLLVETVNRQLTTQKLRLVFRAVNTLLVGILAIVVVWLGAQRVLDEHLPVGMLLAFIAYKDQFLDRVSDLIDKGLDLRMLRLHAERLADIALTDARAARSRRRTSLAPARIDARFDRGPRPSLPLQRERSVGAGRRHLRVERRRVGGHRRAVGLRQDDAAQAAGEPAAADGGARSWWTASRCRAWASSATASMIGVVMQDDQLFAGSIADNICFFADEPDCARIEAVPGWRRVHDDIVAMPMGYSTLIGDMGTVLSGGPEAARADRPRALPRAEHPAAGRGHQPPGRGARGGGQRRDPRARR